MGGPDGADKTNVVIPLPLPTTPLFRGNLDQNRLKSFTPLPAPGRGVCRPQRRGVGRVQRGGGARVFQWALRQTGRVQARGRAWTIFLHPCVVTREGLLDRVVVL